MGRDYAGFGVRFAAYLVDVLLYCGLWFLLMQISGGWDVFMHLSSMGGGANARIIEQYEINQAIWLNITLVALFSVYFVFATASGLRGTIGKMLLGVAIVNSKGQQIGLAKAFGNLLYVDFSHSEASTQNNISEHVTSCIYN